MMRTIGPPNPLKGEWDGEAGARHCEEERRSNLLAKHNERTAGDCFGGLAMTMQYKCPEIIGRKQVTQRCLINLQMLSTKILIT